MEENEMIENIETMDDNTNTEHDVTYYITDSHLTYNMPEAPTANANGDAFISWVDLSGKEFTGTIIDKDSPAVISAKFEHEVQTAVFGEDLYVMYYNSNGNRVLVYQKGNTPDAEYGTLVGSTLLKTATNPAAKSMAAIKPTGAKPISVQVGIPLSPNSSRSIILGVGFSLFLNFEITIGVANIIHKRASI